MSEQPREGTRAHSYPLTPIKGRRGWYRCERCGEEYSEAWPTAMGCAPPCEPAQPQPRGEGDDASQMETNLRMNRWREHLGDDPLDGFGGRGPAEYHYMATHEPEGPGLTRFGNRGFRPAPPRGEGDDLAARTVQIIRNRAKIAREQGTTEAQIIRARALDEAANEFADILPALRASTHPEQSERIVGAALDLLDSLGAPHYHDLIGMTYTLRKEQADNLRRALESASPTPTEQGEGEAS